MCLYIITALQFICHRKNGRIGLTNCKAVILIVDKKDMLDLSKKQMSLLG